MLLLLNVDLDPFAWADALAQKRGGHPKPRAAVDAIAHRIDAERDALGIDRRRGGNGVKARRKRLERLDESFGIGTHAGEFLHGGEHVEALGVTIGGLARRERPGLL